MPEEPSATDEEAMPEEGAGEEAPESLETAPGFSFSIFEWVIVFFIALLGDALDIILHIGTVTIPAAWAIDLTMLAVVGGWAFFRAGAELPEEKIKELKEKRKMLKAPSRWKMFPKKRFAGIFVGELIPWAGMVPFWSIFMLGLLKRY